MATGTVTWSDELFRIYGVPVRSREVTFEFFISCLHPDDHARVARLYAAALAAGTPWRYELRLRRHEGQYRWFVSQGVPEPLADAVAAGRVRQWFCADVDIHELHEA